MALKRSHLIIAGLATGWLVLGTIAWIKASDRTVRGRLAPAPESGQAMVPAKHATSTPSVATVEQAAVVRSPAVDAGAGAQPASTDRAAEFNRTIADVIAEPRDATWARNVEKGLTDKIKDPKLGAGPVTLSTVHCGSTRCTVEASASTFQDASRLTEELSRMGSGLGLGRGRIWRAPPSDSPIVVKAVLAREGFGVDGNKRPPKKSQRAAAEKG